MAIPVAPPLSGHRSRRTPEELQEYSALHELRPGALLATKPRTHALNRLRGPRAAALTWHQSLGSTCRATQHPSRAKETSV